MQKSKYRINQAMHPGYMVGEFMAVASLLPEEFAKELHVTLKTLNALLRKEAPMTPRIAKKLAARFDAPAIYWMNLQKNYERTRQRLKEEGHG